MKLPKPTAVGVLREHATDDTREIWSHLRLTVLHAQFCAERAGRLPEFKGATLRGALGFALKELACLRTTESCQPCPHPGECAFGACFDATRPNGGSQVAPYVLNVPLSRQQQFRPGESLAMSIALVGSARKWTPWVVAALERMGRRGMGWGRTPWSLTSVAAEGPVGTFSKVISGGSRCAELSDREIVAARPLNDSVTIEFLTPTQLKERKDGGRFAAEVTGVLLVRRLMRRLGDLLEQYCGWSPHGFRFQPWIELADQIRCVQQDVRWLQWERYSTRQQRRHSLPGFVGTVRFENVPEVLRPLLAVGEWIHAGKSASFGMGQYRLFCE